MTRANRWKQPTRKRALVLLGVAVVVSLLLVVPRHLAEVMELIPKTQEEVAEQEEKGAGLLEFIYTPGRLLHRFERWTDDSTHLYGVKTQIDPDIIVLGIDDASFTVRDTSAFPEDIEKSRALQIMGKWPWSREVHALVLDRLIAAGAKTVIFDLLLPGESVPFPDGDAVFKRALDEHKGRVLIGADWVTAMSGNSGNDDVALPWDWFIPETWPADERVGSVSFWVEDDGVIRKARFLHSFYAMPERSLPSFAAAIVRLQGRAEIIPNDQADHIIRFSDPAAYLPFAVHEIFVERLWERNFANGEFFKDKTVFVGPSARSLQDFKETTVGTMLGVQVHAHALAALKAGAFLHEMPLALRILLGLAFAFGSALLVLVWKQPVLCMFTLLGVTALGLVVKLLLFNHASLILPLAVPLLAWNLTGFTGMTWDFLVERKQKHALKRSIMRFHSPDVAEQIVANPESYFAIREGAEREIALLFSDVRGFTSIAEQLTAKQMMAHLNEYLDEMVRIVFRHEGAVDKFIGDAVMAVWGRFRDNAQEAQLANDASLAVRAALQMRESLVKLNVGWKAREMPELAIGIGIHQGTAIVGELGSAEKAELTAIGDTVNLASRLEGATKEYGVDLIISAAVHQRVKDQFHCRTADLVRVKGKALPVEVFFVIGSVAEQQPVALELFEQGVRFYREGRFADALRLFQQTQKDGLDDKLTHLYIERCEAMIATPPEKWDGVFVMTKK